MKKSRKILIWLCIGIAVIACGYIIYHSVTKEKNLTIYEVLKKEYIIPQKERTKEDEIPIDFEKLWEMNPEIYAWIEIPGTDISYPIVQRWGDDSYYLNHTIDGKKGYPGSIYTEGMNHQDFRDFNTAVYGHDMKDGSMFKGLHNYEDEAFLKEHPEVIIYTPKKILRYEIFAAVVYDDRHVINTFRYELKEERQRFLDSIYEARDMRNTYRDDITVSPEDRILTLSTCIGNESEKRFLVEAVLKDE